MPGRWYGLHHSIAILKSKRLRLEWLATRPGGDVSRTLDNLRQDCTTILIPPFDSEPEGRVFIEVRYEPLFEMELEE